jgi:NAD(P)-dependent dehydrogenase (short-subunit alcohol dehydrogenase family)
MTLDGRITLITGAANGIGEATARRFAKDGARLVLTDVEMERLAQVVADIRAGGADVLQYQMDVTRRQEVQSVFDAVRAEWSVPQIVLHIAGVAAPSHFLQHSDADWDRTIAVNLTGSFIVGQVAAQAMVDAGIAGSIVLMASTNGLVAEEDLAAYNASKFGVVGLMKTMAVDLAKHNIRVNSVNPGLIRSRLTECSWEGTPQGDWYTRERIPMRRLGSPDEVAACFRYLASDDASFITGHTLVVDGGQLTI